MKKSFFGQGTCWGFRSPIPRDFWQQSLRCLLAANTVLITLRKSKGEENGKKENGIRSKRKRIFVRVSEAMYELISYEAEKSGLSISEFCRRVLLNRPIKKLPVIIHDEREIIQELRNINNVGNNLNQIARYLNEGGQMNETLSQEIRKTLTTLDLSIYDFNSAVEAEYGQSS